MHEPHKCLVCNVRLNVWEREGKRIWTHAGESVDSDRERYDHAPVAVPEVEFDLAATLVCDFCSAPDPSWRYRARAAEQTMVLEDRDGGIHTTGYADNNPDWIACERCHGLIESNNRIGLIAYSMDRMVKVGRIQRSDYNDVAPQVAFMHNIFFTHRYPEPAQRVRQSLEDT